MKKKILLGSLYAASVATILGVSSVSTANGLCMSLAFISGLLSISMFFVGWVYPVETVETITESHTDRGLTSKRVGSVN